MYGSSTEPVDVTASDCRSGRGLGRHPGQSLYRQFSRHSQFDASADADSVAIRLVRLGGDRREAVIHLHYGLLAAIIAELAGSLTARDPFDEQHRSELSEAAMQLAASLEPQQKNCGPARNYPLPSLAN
jgi:hypothetical protein